MVRRSGPAYHPLKASSSRRHAYPATLTAFVSFSPSLTFDRPTCAATFEVLSPVLLSQRHPQGSPVSLA